MTHPSPEMSQPRSELSTPVRLPWDEEKSALRARLLTWARDPQHPGRALHFTYTQALGALRTSPWKLHEIAAELIHEKILVQFDDAVGGRHRGWGMRGMVAPRRSLAELMQLVEDAPVPAAGHLRRRGRLTVSEEHAPVTALSEAQKKDLRGVAGLIAESADSAHGDASRVTAAFLARTVPNEGRLIWALENEVDEWTNARAAARAAAQGTLWRPTESEWARAKARTSVKLLLRFARSIGWLTPDEPVPAVHQHAPELHPLVIKWRGRLERRGSNRNRPQIRLGVTTIALALTRRGSLRLAAADWPALLKEIESEAEAGTLRGAALRAVHYVWRRVHLLQRVRKLNTTQSRRVSIIPQVAITRVVESVASATSAEGLDFSGWVSNSGEPLTALVEGKYGLRRWIWYTAGNNMHVAADRGMPARTYEPKYLARRKRDRVSLTDISLNARLTHVAMLAGWTASFDSEPLRPSTSQSSPSLRDIFDAQRLAGFSAWRKQQPKFLTHGPIGEGNGQLHPILSTCRRATVDLSMIAAHDGDEAMRAMLDADLVLLERLVAQAYTDQDRFRDCLAINEAWRGASRTHGLQKLVQFRDLVVADACDHAGLSVAEQLSELRAYRSMPSKSAAERAAKANALAAMTWRTASWATGLRRAFLIQLVRKVPLREKALRNLSRTMLVAKRDGGTCDPWDAGATLHVDVPGKFTKNGERYFVAYIASDQAGDAVHEEGAARWLLELWLAPGGGLDRLVESAPATVILRDYVFPVNATRGEQGHGERKPRTSMRLAASGISADWATALKTHHEALGVDLEELQKVHGGTGIHSVRYLFGRYWAAIRTLLSYASDLLHHNDLTITKNRYVGPEGSGVSHEVSDVPVSPSTLASGDLAAENAQLRQQLQELERRLQGSTEQVSRTN